MNPDLFAYNGWYFRVVGRTFTLDVRDEAESGWRVSCFVTDPQGTVTAVEVLFDGGWQYPPTAEDVCNKLRRYTGAKIDPV